MKNLKSMSLLGLCLATLSTVHAETARVTIGTGEILCQSPTSCQTPNILRGVREIPMTEKKPGIWVGAFEENSLGYSYNVVIAKGHFGENQNLYTVMATVKAAHGSDAVVPATLTVFTRDLSQLSFSTLTGQAKEDDQGNFHVPLLSISAPSSDTSSADYYTRVNPFASLYH